MTPFAVLMREGAIYPLKYSYPFRQVPLRQSFTGYLCLLMCGMVAGPQFVVSRPKSCDSTVASPAICQPPTISSTKPIRRPQKHLAAANGEIHDPVETYPMLRNRGHSNVIEQMILGILIYRPRCLPESPGLDRSNCPRKPLPPFRNAEENT